MKNVFIYSLIFHRNLLNIRIVCSFVGERDWIFRVTMNEIKILRKFIYKSNFGIIKNF